PLLFVEVLGLLGLFAAFFSAVPLTITSFARSFKEAQGFLGPLMLAAPLAGGLSLVPGVELNGPVVRGPLKTVVLLAQAPLGGTAAPGPAVIVVLSTVLYAGAALGFAAGIFGTEAVLTDQQSGWADLFTRPREARDAVPLSTALLTLALLF